MFQKRYAEAMQAYGEALQAAPNDLFAMQGREDARRFLIGAINMQSSSSTPRCCKPRSCALKQEYAKASEQLNRLAEVHSSRLRPTSRRRTETAQFVTAMAQGKTSLTTQRLRRRSDLVSPPNALQIAALRGEEKEPFAVQGLQTACMLGKAKFDRSIVNGKAALDAGNYPEAVTAFMDARASVSDHPLAEQAPLVMQADQALLEAQRLGQPRVDEDLARQQGGPDRRGTSPSPCPLSPMPCGSSPKSKRRRMAWPKLSGVCKARPSIWRRTSTPPSKRPSSC